MQSRNLNWSDFTLSEFYFVVLQRATKMRKQVTHVEHDYYSSIINQWQCFFSFIADAHLFYRFRRWIKLLPCCIINYKNKNIESFYFHPPIIISTLFQILNVRLRLFATE